MKRWVIRKDLFSLLIFLSLMITPSLTSVQARIPLTVGDEFPDALWEQSFSMKGINYLGLKEKVDFKFDEIDAELILLEVLFVYCPTCQEQAGIITKLYEAIEKDPAIKGKIKILGLAIGNSAAEVQNFRKEYKIPYPVVPDAKFEIVRISGTTRVPLHILIRKSSEEMVVARFHDGYIKECQDYLEDMRSIMTYKIAAIKITTREGSFAPIKPLKPDIPEQELISLVKKGMQEVGGEILEFKEVKLKNEKMVYMGRVSKKNVGKKLFAKVVSREAICDVCEKNDFMFVFDTQGKIVNFTPILLPKLGNKKWDEKDLKKMNSRVLGRHLYDDFSFNHVIDAVSSATITSSLIFDSLERADAIYQELKEKGYLR